MKHTDTGEHIKNKPCQPHQGHAHTHGENCGHKAIRHEDHIDYEHDGHLHRIHGSHVDECRIANYDPEKLAEGEIENEHGRNHEGMK